ncbi:UTRA domain-containing protein [Sphingomonas sp. 1P06PA]|uniref:UTRA domain-containing protein n=1 Tax=Sphingomonas sp. 1P06PA TaxID=554121 RepID=UPI0039A47AB3
MSAPLHQRIRANLEEAIASGDLPPGARIPTEQALMADYSCARMTVSKALGALADAGLIERRKGAGSFVAQRRTHALMLAIPDLAAEIARRGEAYRYRLTRRVRRGGQLSLDGVHLANERPFAIERRTIALGVVPDAAAVDFTALAPGAWLLAHVPWSEAGVRISAVAANAAEAMALAVERGTACLAIDRSSWRGADRVTEVRQLFIGTGWDLVARFGPQPR